MHLPSSINAENATRRATNNKPNRSEFVGQLVALPAYPWFSESFQDYPFKKPRNKLWGLNVARLCRILPVLASDVLAFNWRPEDFGMIRLMIPPDLAALTNLPDDALIGVAAVAALYACS